MISGSSAVSLCTNVPTSTFSLISAFWVVGVKYGALLLLLMILIVIDAVPDKLGIPKSDATTSISYFGRTSNSNDFAIVIIPV